MKPANPFIINGYEGPEYFCDREKESAELVKLIANGNNVSLISPRRMGKSGLIKHSLQNSGLEKDHYTFYVDIYASRNMEELVFEMAKTIIKTLKPLGEKIADRFLEIVKSLQAGISFDYQGNPSLNLQAGSPQRSQESMDEIFRYLDNAGKPCIVAIDEFQQIATYPEKNIEAILRTHVQQCSNAKFIFSGSQRHVMGSLFLSPSKPFYQSTSMMALGSIDLEKYCAFAKKHFTDNGKNIDNNVLPRIYAMFDGVTWYIQKLLNELYSMTSTGGTCSCDMIETALRDILDTMDYVYSEILFRLPDKQKQLLVALAKENSVAKINSGGFAAKYGFLSASSVQSATRGLLEKDFITHESGTYRVYDKFLKLWLQRRG